MKRVAGNVIVAAMRWVDAINAPGDASRLGVACTPDMVLERMGVHDKQGQLAETFRGLDEVARWLERMPEGVVFELGGDMEATKLHGAEAYALRYVYRIAKLQFVHGGMWTLRLADDGRIARLRHDPDPLPEALDAGGHDAGGEHHGHVH